MNELKIFNNEEFGEVRVVMQNNEPWFVAKDVCRILDIANTTQALERLDDDERSMLNIGYQDNTLCSNEGIAVGSGNPNVNIVNEPGLYNLIFGSRKPEAKAFRRWVTHDVLPVIRKTGRYAAQSATPENVLQEKIKCINTLSDKLSKSELVSLYRAAHQEAMNETGKDYGYTVAALLLIEERANEEKPGLIASDKHVLRFFDSVCKLIPQGFISTSYFHMQYMTWCRQHKIPPLMYAKDVTDIVVDAYPELSKGKKGFYHGFYGA